METTLSITTPSAVYEAVAWPQGVPYPSAGDTVHFRKDEQTWSFEVLSRTIDIGFDPRTMQPGAAVRLRVSDPPPAGLDPQSPLR